MSRSEQEKVGGVSKPSKPEGKNDKGKKGGEIEMRYKSSPLNLSVFRQELETGNVVRNLQLQRVYTTDDGDSFQYTNSLRPQDLRKAARLLELAADEIEGVERVEPGNGGEA